MIYVVTYRRVSTEEQAENDLSLPAQDKAMARWLAERPDHKLVSSFCDQGVSAYAPADQRPGFQEMIRFCLKNRIDLVLVHKLDRFSRHRRECAIFKDMLARKEVKVRSVCEEFDPDTAQGVLLEGILETLAQFFSMNLSSETLKGMRENAERGWFNGGAVPFGYRVVRVKHGAREYGRLEPGDEAQVATVREIFDLAVEQGKGCRTIAVLFNQRKVPSPSGTTWSPGSVHSILTNPCYAGDSVWGKSKKRGRSGRQRTTTDERIVVPDTHEGLVPCEVFDRYQKIAAARPFRPKNPKATSLTEPLAEETGEDGALARKPVGRDRPVKNLLAGFIRCRHCGHSFYGVDRFTRRGGQRVPRPIYICNGYLSKGAAVCTSLALPKDWIESRVVTALRERLCTPEGKARINEAVRAHITSRRDAFTHDKASLQRLIADCDRRIQNFFRAIGEGVEPATCKQHISELTEKKMKLDYELELLTQEDIYGRALAKNLALLDDFSASFAPIFERLSLHRRREILHRFVSSIEVHEHRLVRVHLRVPFDTSGLDTLLAPTPGEEAGVPGEGGEGVVRGSLRRQSDRHWGAIPHRSRTPADELPGFRRSGR